MDKLQPGETAYVSRAKLRSGEPAIAVRSSPEVIRHTDLLDLGDCVLVQRNDGGNPHHAGLQIWVVHKEDLETT